MGQKLIYVPECHSTNSMLSELAAGSDLPEGTVVVTDHQTNGRGQRGNSWQSAKGQNLTLSIFLKPKFLEIKDQFQLSMAISLGVSACLKDLVSMIVSLKWPNDVFIGERKVGGILIENQTQGVALTGSIIGIGLNINQSNYAVPNAGALIDFTGKFTDLNWVFERLMGTLEASYLDLRSGNAAGIRKKYLESLYQFNQPVSFESAGEQFIGIISDVDEYGRLCVQTGGATRKFSLQEIRMLHG